MTLEQAKELKPNQHLYYKSIYTLLFYEIDVRELKYDIHDKLEVHLQDGSYVPEKDLEQLFLTKEDCIKSCIKDLESRIKLLKNQEESI